MLETHVLHIAGERVELRSLRSGDLAVYHRPAEHVRALVEPICRNRGHWNSVSGNRAAFLPTSSAGGDRIEADWPRSVASTALG